MTPRHHHSSIEQLRGGSYWCPHCKAPADISDPGDAYPMCARCNHRGLEWRGEVTPATTPRAPQFFNPPVPDDAAPPVHRRRLPAEKRNLKELALTGYLMCDDCEHVTEDVEGRCLLCGSSRLTYCPAVFSE